MDYLNMPPKEGWTFKKVEAYLKTSRRSPNFNKKFWEYFGREKGKEVLKECRANGEEWENIDRSLELEGGMYGILHRPDPPGTDLVTIVKNYGAGYAPSIFRIHIDRKRKVAYYGVPRTSDGSPRGHMVDLNHLNEHAKNFDLLAIKEVLDQVLQ